jgi:hypothetical protein
MYMYMSLLLRSWYMLIAASPLMRAHNQVKSTNIRILYGIWCVEQPAYHIAY